MPIRDTTTADPCFLTVEPDWSLPVLLVVSFKTTVAESQSQGEQRASWRLSPRYALSYTVSALTVSELAKRRVAVLAELRAPLIVPIWTDEFLWAVRDSDSVWIAEEPRVLRLFKVGGYAYLKASGTFRKIVSVVLYAGFYAVSFESGGTEGEAGSSFYPCMTARHTRAVGSFDSQRLDQAEETISVEEL